MFYKKKIFYFVLLFLFLFSGCKKDDYYTIDKVIIEDEELLYNFNNENLIFSEEDKTNFYINSQLTIKELLNFDNATEETKLKLIDEINLNAYLYGNNLSDYSFRNLKTGEAILFRKIAKNKPFLIVKLSAFCDACDNFDFKWLEKLKNNDEFDYMILVENVDEEAQYEYIIEKGGDENKIYVCDGSLNGDDVLKSLATPDLLFLSSDNTIRIVSEYFLLDENAIISYLNIAKNN